jgi:pullulanase
VAVAHGWSDLAPPRLTRAGVEAGFAAGALYLRGSLNDWGTSQPMPALAPRHHVLEVEVAAGRHEFKFASADWKAVDLGADETGPGLAFSGGNLVLEVPSPGRYRFELDARDALQPRHRVERITP